MTSRYVDVSYWCTAASNARAIAETLDDRTTRLAMLEIAGKLEAIAKRARDLETGLNTDGRQRKAS